MSSPLSLGVEAPNVMADRIAELEAEVARLRGVLAEPTDEEARRLVNLMQEAWNRSDAMNFHAKAVDQVRVLLADLRARAGGADEVP